MNGESYSFWLLPEAALEQELAKLVRALAPLFGMPSFGPHATVQGDLDQRARPRLPVVLTVMHLCWGLGFLRGLPAAENPRLNGRSG